MNVLLFNDFINIENFNPNINKYYSQVFLIECLNKIKMKMGNTVKEINIKNHTCCFFYDIINTKNLVQIILN